MHYSPISAADIGILDLFNKTEGFQGARRNRADKPRDATHDEIHAYMRWVAKRAGVDVSHGTHCELKWSEYARGVESRCIGATIGDVFVPMPGADQNGAVECELLDEAGNVERAFTMRPKGGRGGKLECAKADEAALKAANKGKAKRAPKAAPVADTAPPAPPLEEIESQSAPVASLAIYDAPIGPELPAQAPVSAEQVPAPECEAATPYDTLAARVAEIEARLAAIETNAPQSGELAPSLAEYEANPDMGGQHGRSIARLRAVDTGLATERAARERAKRERIVRRYLAMRKDRANMRADYVEAHDIGIKAGQERNKALESCQQAWKDLIAMEAQRDHAREELKAAIQNAKRLDANFEAAQGEIARAERQRDEARAERDHARDYLLTALADKAALECDNVRLKRNRARLVPFAAKHRLSTPELHLVTLDRDRLSNVVGYYKEKMEAILPRLTKAEAALNRAGIFHPVAKAA